MKHGSALKDRQGEGRRQSTLVRFSVMSVAGGFVCFFLGFLHFLSQVQAAESARPARADAIVVFSGEPKRIEVGANFLLKGFARQLIIVGQDNGENIAKLQDANKALFDCCVKVDQRSINTAQDAELAKNLLNRVDVNSIILVTSSFHVPRAKIELSREVPETHITSYGVSDDFYKVSDILKSSDVASAFLLQYVLYVSSHIPGTRNLWEEESARDLLGAISNFKNIALLLLVAFAAIIGAFSFSRHRNRGR